MRLLIADDDPRFVRALTIVLRRTGYEVLAADDGASALEVARRERPDVYLIDLGLPRLDGLRVIDSLRGWSHAPILVISGRTDSVDKVRALDVGADDYVTKPFAVAELLARIRALVRRAGSEDEHPVAQLGDVRVDAAARSASRECAGAARPIHLTPTEWRLVEVLLSRPDQLVAGRELLERVWGPGHADDSAYLRFYMSQIRKKLEGDPEHPRFFVTEPRMGYRFVPEGDTDS